MTDVIRENGNAEASACSIGADFKPEQLLSMARGFSCAFLGLLIALVLFFANASFEIFNTVRIPAYVVGSVIAAWGLLMLNGSGHVSGCWGRRGRIALLMVLLQIYFFPFVGWRRAAPHDTFLFMNWLILILTGMFSLFCLNLLASENARCLHDRAGWMESVWFAGSVVLFMIMPFGFFVLRRCILYFNCGAMPCHASTEIINSVPLWAYALAIVPCAMTLVSLWKARDRCYRAFSAGG